MPIGREPQLPGYVPELPFFDLKNTFLSLKADTPLVMLPVRLETRFKGQVLQLRIYPDQIHVDDHQRQLSAAEIKMGRRFWELLWQADRERHPRLFQRMADNLGVWRAAWVAEAMTPTNVERLGTDRPQFPKREARRDRTPPATLRLLPDRWFAIGYLAGEVVFVEHGNVIPESLWYAPLEHTDKKQSSNWLVNFESAVKVGMAMEIEITGTKTEVASQGLDELIVVGARLDETPEAAAAAFEDLLQAHFYKRGFDFLPQGTPTNNTEGERSPWAWNTADAQALFERWMHPTDPTERSYRDQFSRVMGVDPAGIVSRVLHGDVTDLPEMEAMNHALWYIMFGEYLRFMLHDGEDPVLTEKQIDWLRDWFVDHIRGGAVYPAFNVGSMPYGVLPIQLQPVPSDAGSGQEYLQVALTRLRQGWERSLPNVPHLDPTATATATDAPETTDLETANENLVALLSSGPHPARFFTRNLYNTRTILFGLFDPVGLVEASIEVLRDKLIEARSDWSLQLVHDIDYALLYTVSDQVHFWRDVLERVDAQIETLTAQIAALDEEIDSLPPTLSAPQQVIRAEYQAELALLEGDAGVGTICSNIVFLLETHQQRVSPLRDLGFPSAIFEDLLDEETPNPEHFFFHFRDEISAWGENPFVQAPDAEGAGTAAVYLNWLYDFAQGTVQDGSLEGLPDPAPLLYQLIRRAILRANAWDSGSVSETLEILQSLSRLAEDPNISSRYQAVDRFAKRPSAVARTTQTLRSARLSDTPPAVRQAIANISGQVFSQASRQLSNYSKLSTAKNDALDALKLELDGWAADPKPTPQSEFDLDKLPWLGGGRLQSLANAIQTLSVLPPEVLEQRMVETLGLAMHRLDAWIAAYTEQRIENLRADLPTGMQLGGFGWVENLRPDEAGTEESQGYIHAPSMTHAATAAVLRSGYSAYSDGTATSPFAVDLSSDRVRVANWVIDGLRQGNRLNDLLGYRFERYLHDNNLDIWIDAVRDIVAEAGNSQLTDTTNTVIVDGIALLELWNDGQGTLATLLPHVADESGRKHPFSEIQPALEYLVWVTDALADLNLAESVHALVQGDYDLASAIQSAASLGDVPPPEPRAIRSPNTGMTITHKLVVALQQKPSHWNTRGSVRAALEPALEAWVSSVLGDPDQYLYRIRGGDGPVEVRNLGDCVLSALDAVYLAPPGENFTDSDLAAFLAHDYRMRHKLADAAVEIDLVPNTNQGQTPLLEWLVLAKAVRRVLGAARSGTPEDFILGSMENAAARVDITGFLRKVADLNRRLGGALKTLAAKPNFHNLMAVTAFNLPLAIPQTLDTETLQSQVQAALAAGNKRLEQVTALLEHHADAAPEVKLKQARTAAGILMGRDFPIMPFLTVPIPPKAIQPESALVPDDPRPATGWLMTVGRVRSEVGTITNLINLSDIMEAAADSFPLWVAQIPYQPGEPWAALARPNADGDDRLSLVITTNGELSDLPRRIQVLVLDEWTERIPSDYEMTGVAFHFDAPTSRPPQSVLVALPPENEQWDFDRLVATVQEAFALGRMRSVAPETLDEYGQQLPIVYLTSNLDMTGENNG